MLVGASDGFVPACREMTDAIMDHDGTLVAYMGPHVSDGSTHPEQAPPDL